MSNEYVQKQNQPSLRRSLRSFRYAINGLRALFRDEPNSRIHLLAACLIHLIGFWLRFSIVEWVAIWLCIGFVFAAEIFNTAIENLCDHVSPERNSTIGKVKDLAAAGVLVAATTSVVVALFILVERVL